MQRLEVESSSYAAHRSAPLYVERRRFTRHDAVKRALDIVLASLGLVATLPIWLGIVLAIKANSPGPAIFTQERVGQRGRRFRFHKFRSMYVDAESRLNEVLAHNETDGPVFKMRNDPRVTRVGAFLRRTSLDELPQLINVLKGEMSLVGPRPFPAYHLESFDGEFRRLRQRVLPGLTGLWQVSERSDGDIAVQRSLDTYYIRNWSIWQDIYLLVATLRAVLLSKGAY